MSVLMYTPQFSFHTIDSIKAIYIQMYIDNSNGEKSASVLYADDIVLLAEKKIIVYKFYCLFYRYI